MRSIPNEVVANAAKVKEHTRHAAEAGAELVVFPELCLTGNVAGACDHAIARDSSVLAELADAAQSCGVAVSVGYFEADGEKRYVAQAFLEDGRIRNVYRKVFACEGGASDGETFEVVDWRGIPTGTTICRDLFFPLATREHVKRGALLILHPAAYSVEGSKPFTHDNHNVYLPRARAHENGVFFLHVNASGSHDGGKTWFRGNSVLAGPDGCVIARVDHCPFSENMLIADIDIEEAKASDVRDKIEEESRRMGVLDRATPGK